MSQAPAFRSSVMFENFNLLLREYEPMIYHLLNKYGVKDPEKEYYQELAIALWQATKQYEEGVMKFSTFAYSKMKYRLIDLFRKENRLRELKKKLQQEQRQLVVYVEQRYDDDHVFFQQVRQVLTERELLWLEGEIFQGKTLVEIAKEHQVKPDAVRNWKRRATAKIKKLL